MKRKTKKKKLVLTPKIISIYALIGIILILLFFKFRSLIVFILITAAAGYLNYFIHLMDFHIHLGHVAFLTLLFSYALGFKYGIFIIIFAHILPEILAGHIDSEMFVSAGVYVLLSFLAFSFNTSPIVSLGILLSLLLALLTMSIEYFMGTPIFELLTEHGVETVMLIVYFVSFAKPILFLIK